DGSRDALWMATAVEGPTCAELSADVECEIGVLGAGLTGLNAALELASKGISVCVLEAETVGFGASGRSGGQVNLGLNLGPTQLLEKYGAEQGRRTVDAVIKTPTTVFERIEKYSLNCDPVQRGWIQGAINDRTKAEQAAMVEDYANFGCDLSLVERAEMVERVGTDFYTGGLLVPAAGTLQPLSYTRELARVAQEKGVKIYTRSRVESLAKLDDGWRLQTLAGSVRCRQVLVCSNGYTDRAVHGLAQRVVPVRSILVASEPLSDDLRDTVLPGHLSFVDKRRLILYFRYDRHGRLCAGYHGPMRDAFRPSDFDLLKSKVSTIFPQLKNTRWDYHWGGRIAMTKDSLPFFSELQPGLLACMGYNGRGVGMGTMMGINAARYLSGDCVDELAFPVTNPAKFLMHRFHKLGVNASIAWFEVQELLDGRPYSSV
ncbi:MAG: NAD(P)/FAD-dependent oxidoreductase, partial [Granulosicoccaceae bacterium]